MSLRNRTPLLFLIWFLASSVSAHGQAVIPDHSRAELRAFWVDGFNDGFQTPAQCDLLLARVRAAHMNAVFVQVRKRSDAYYASHYEPWATDDPQHFDALEYVCRIAHARGLPRIQVHAWVNATAIGGHGGPQPLVRLHPDWLSLSDTGSDFDGESSKIDPGNPDAADWTERVYLDIVRHYPIDGIHLDFIRYGGSGTTAGHWGYNPVSVARYNARYGTTRQPVWNDPRWMQWRRDQVTALVRRVSVEAHALKPHLIVSAATICWGDGPKDDADYEATSAAYTQVFASWRDWLREGLLDINCPMTYFDNSRHPDYWRHWSAFVKDHQYGRLSAMGVGTWINTVPETLSQIVSTRQPTGQGNAAAGVVLFSYAGTDSANGQEEQYNPSLYDALPTVFPSDVPPPAMPWRDTPKAGAIMGTVLRGSLLRPVANQLVFVLGSPHSSPQVRRMVETDGNGFFACTDLPPASYTVEAYDFTHRPPSSPRMAVFYPVTVPMGGSVTTDCLFTMDGGTVRKLPVAGLGRTPEGRSLVVTHAVVLNGSDRLGDDFYIADDFGKPFVRVHSPGLVPPTVAGDIVAVSGTLRHTTGGAVIIATVVYRLGARLLP